ncbi:potassium channel family protein [Haloglomus halophilum]|uniref:potassium channel family protein n=1 Tax=Haloglomus halophilum TaxID=2962672 RepID=UPI0020C9FFE7|nr:NAD-binding protein [Haloglomus halophilum]
MDPRDLATFAYGDRGSSNAARQRRRIALYLVGLVGIAVLYALAYQAALFYFEGVRISFAKAALTVVESFTTTGYGEDSELWTTTPVQMLLVSMQLTGVTLIFLALPVFLAPWVEERLSQTAPTAVENLSDHVVLAGYSSRGEALIDELDTRDHPYVVVEPDRDAANELHTETDITVIHGDPKLTKTLQAANVDRAHAVVADIGDEANASIALAAGHLDGPDPGIEDAQPETDGETQRPQVVTFVEDDDNAAYHRYAGADDVFSPRHLIGESIARKVSAGVRPELDGSVQLGEGEDFDIVELPVQSGSELAGVTVAESGIRERTGANIIGAWFRGEFVSPPPPDARIDGQTILVASGREESLERLKGLTLSQARGLGTRGSRVVLAGFDEVGTTVLEDLDAHVPTTVIDLRDKDGVDVVGDVTEPETLREADTENAGTVILTVSSDVTAVFATLVIRELYPDVEIIARADATESVRKLYQAGADYVLAVATVAGRMLASTILEEDIISFDQQVELVRIDCGDLAGKSLGEADVRARTGVTVIAVERDSTFLSDIGPAFVVEPGDSLIVAGTDEDVNRFNALVETD